MGISVVFAAYNEEKNVVSAMARALEALRAQFEKFEIIIVEDASRDGTAAICDQLAAAHPEIRVLHNEKNMGQGASLVRGFAAARHEFVTHNAMDYPFDLRDLAVMMPLLQEADIVVAARKSRAGYSPYRVLTSAVHRTLLHLLFPLRLRDYNFVQVYPRAVWQAVKVEARSTAFLTPEALIRAHDLGYRVKEVEIEYHPRTAGVATSGRPKVILHSLGDMFRFWWKRARRRTPRAAGRSTST
ncbi:MAG: glycosyltransferase family 2 protein [Acidobacteriia bacterium]|nr:glycosyltransferase family 2 protein [Terriglobia bacterium]